MTRRRRRSTVTEAEAVAQAAAVLLAGLGRGWVLSGSATLEDGQVVAEVRVAETEPGLTDVLARTTRRSS